MALSGAVTGFMVSAGAASQLSAFGVMFVDNTSQHIPLCLHLHSSSGTRHWAAHNIVFLDDVIYAAPGMASLPGTAAVPGHHPASRNTAPEAIKEERWARRSRIAGAQIPHPVEVIAMIEIRPIHPHETGLIRSLAGVLWDCVHGGASVSFVEPFPLEEAEAFFTRVFDGLGRGDRILLGAFLDGRLVGTVQVLTAMPPNQLHRGEIAKLLVDRSARGMGVAQRLMEEVEVQARAAGKTLLTLDTVTGSVAHRLYRRLGWTVAGDIPRYAVFPDGTPCSTTFFWKFLD